MTSRTPAELFHHYKPDPESYFGAAAMLDVPPAQTMLVAAHEDDLLAARAAGLPTAFVRLPLDFEDLARQLGV